MAGAPGFEPGIAGPKPAALPLGYAPSIAPGSIGALLRPGRAVPVHEQQDDRDRREDPGQDQDERADEEGHDDGEYGKRLRERQREGDGPADSRVQRPAREQVEEDDGD